MKSLGQCGHRKRGYFHSGNRRRCGGGLSIDAKGTGALNLNNTGTGDILIGGGGGSTGCTVTNSSGNLTCAGTISGSGITATALKWNALTAPDGNLSLAHAGYTTAFTYNSVTTADAFGLSSTSLTTGTLLDLSSTSTAGGASGVSKLWISPVLEPMLLLHTAYGAIQP